MQLIITDFFDFATTKLLDLFYHYFYDKISCMKKTFTVFSVLCLSTSAFADSLVLPETDPFMGKYQQQIAFGVGQGFDTGIYYRHQYTLFRFISPHFNIHNQPHFSEFLHAVQ